MEDFLQTSPSLVSSVHPTLFYSLHRTPPFRQWRRQFVHREKKRLANQRVLTYNAHFPTNTHHPPRELASLAHSAETKQWGLQINKYRQDMRSVTHPNSCIIPTPPCIHTHSSFIEEEINSLFKMAYTVSIFVLCLSFLLSEARYHTLHVGIFRRNHQQELAKCPTSRTGVRGSSPGATIALVHGICSPPRPVNSSWENLLSQRLEQDSLRLRTILSRKNDNSGDAEASAVDLPLKSGTQFDTGNYIASVGIGTPAKNYLLTIDTGSDITWMQCKPCAGVRSCYSQVDPIFDPQQSSSYQRLPCLSAECTELTVSETFKPCLLGNCVYQVRYGDGSKSEGDFSRETLKIGPDSFPNFAFGCGHTNTGLFKGSAGLLGLGRNNLAFPAQTTSKYGGQFSYCVPDFASASARGSLSFGSGSIPPSAVSTPLLSSMIYPSFYFVGLEGISVGGEMLPIPASVFRQGLTGGGTILDSGTIITRLLPQAYEALKASFRKKTSNLPSAQGFSILDTCYDLSNYKNVKIPTVTFHYGNNAAVDVSSVGILVQAKSDASQVCLAFASASENDDLNIIGNFQQQRMRIAYDTTGRKISFKPQSCGSVPKN